jgi:hypothetical protein
LSSIAKHNIMVGSMSKHNDALNRKTQERVT